MSTATEKPKVAIYGRGAPATNGAKFEISVRFDMRAMDGWPCEKIEALLAGVAKVISAVNHPDGAQEQSEASR